VIRRPWFTTGEEAHALAQVDQVQGGIDAALVAADDGELFAFERTPIFNLGRMQRMMGKAGPRSLALGTFFGFLSSSCSFAALSSSRALFQKGAGLVPALAFLLASTNLVIELGIVIAVFLSWHFVVAEYVGANKGLGALIIVSQGTLEDFEVILRWVAAAAASWRGLDAPSAIEALRFHGVLLPGDAALLRLTPGRHEGLRFELRARGVLLAQGRLVP